MKIKQYYLKRKTITIKDGEVPYGKSVLHSGDVARIAKSILKNEAKENFLVFCLDMRSNIIGFEKVSSGTVESCPVHPRDVFHAAIKLMTSRIVVVHNHPSGDSTPSRADRTLTRQLKGASDLLGIPILDHIIIGDEKHFSFSESGLLEKL